MQFKDLVQNLEEQYNNVDSNCFDDAGFRIRLLNIFMLSSIKLEKNQVKFVNCENNMVKIQFPDFPEFTLKIPFSIIKLRSLEMSRSLTKQISLNNSQYTMDFSSLINEESELTIKIKETF